MNHLLWDEAFAYEADIGHLEPSQLVEVLSSRDCGIDALRPSSPAIFATHQINTPYIPPTSPALCTALGIEGAPR